MSKDSIATREQHLESGASEMKVLDKVELDYLAELAKPKSQARSGPPPRARHHLRPGQRRSRHSRRSQRPNHGKLTIYTCRLLQVVSPHLRRGHRVQPHRMEHRRAQWCVITFISPCLRPTHPTCTSRWPQRTEYRNKTITRIFGGNARYGCYFLALCIFSAGMVRDAL